MKTHITFKHRESGRKRLFFLTVFILYASVVQAKTVLGTMVEVKTRTPITNGVVMILDGKNNLREMDVTDSLGRFGFENVTLRKFNIRTYRYGYLDVSAGPFSFAERDTFLMMVEIMPEPIELDSLSIEGSQINAYLDNVGFYGRMKKGQGTFISEAEIDFQSPHSMADLIRNIPGMMCLSTGGDFSTNIYSTRYIHHEIPVHVYVDGAAVDPEVLNIIDPNQVRGVEVYPSSIEAPSRYRGNWYAGGVILIWTKH